METPKEYIIEFKIDTTLCQLIETILQQLAEVERNKQLLTELLQRSIKFV
jgi:hypothetical protein